MPAKKPTAPRAEYATKPVTPLMNEWEQSKIVPEPYRAGSWGPRAADDLLRREGRDWRQPQV